MEDALKALVIITGCGVWISAEARKWYKETKKK